MLIIIIIIKYLMKVVVSKTWKISDQCICKIILNKDKKQRKENLRVENRRDKGK